MKSQKWLALFVLTLLGLILAACGGATTAASLPTITAVPPTDTLPTAMPPKDTPPPSDTPEPQNVAGPGDPQRGREIFETGNIEEGLPEKFVCTRCHSLDGSDGGGPTLQGIAGRAADRVPGLSAEEYIRQSILEGRAFTIEGYAVEMGGIYKLLFSEQEMNDLVAFLLTQTPPDRGAAPDITGYLEMDYSAGDAQSGGLTALKNGCGHCHLNATHPGVRGPQFTATDDLPRIAERAELRLADPAYAGQATTNREYLIESILLPDVYVAPGDWKVPMQSFHGQLTDAELADILAWIETLE